MWQLAEWIKEFFQRTESVADFEYDRTEYHNSIETTEEVVL